MSNLPQRSRARWWLVFTPAPVGLIGGFMVLGSRSDAEANARMAVAVVIVTSLGASECVLRTSGVREWARLTAWLTIAPPMLARGGTLGHRIKK